MKIISVDFRLRRLAKNIFGSAAARGINLIISLAIVPITINSLSPGDYAFLAMAISVSALSAYADLGLGLAIVNTLASESSSASQSRSQRAISVVWFTLLVIATTGIAITVGGHLWVSSFLTNISDASRYQALLLGAACVFAGLPTGLVQRVLFARHRITEANAWSTGGRLLSLLFVWGNVHLGYANLKLLVFGIIGVPVIVGWLSMLVIFGRKNMKVLIPSRRHYDNRLLKPYLATGLSFLIMQLVPYAEIGIDTLLAGTLVDISVVPALDVYNRLYTYVPALMSIALFPLWPVIAQAKRERDIAWIIKIKNRAYILVATTAVIIGLFFMVYGNSIVERWTSKQLVLPTGILICMSIFSVMTCIGTVQSMILNGLGVIGRQAVLYLIYLIVLLLAKSSAATAFGLQGMFVALISCYFFRLLMAERMLGNRL
ncbi:MULTISPECIES: lipopolysaccharide biosynthesis protein [Cupriavidus]